MDNVCMITAPEPVLEKAPLERYVAPAKPSLVGMSRARLADWPGESAPEGAIVPTDGGRLVTNIVMMGMGEPLYNFEAVRDALQVISDGDGIAISKRRITLSTSGVVPMIER